MSFFQNLADTTVEALTHAVGLRLPRFDQAVLYILFGAALIKKVLACGFALSGGAEPVGEFFSVIRQDRNGAFVIKRSRKARAFAALLWFTTSRYTQRVARSIATCRVSSG